MKLTNEDVQEILRLLDAASFEVLQIHTEQFKLTLRRNHNGGWSQERQIVAPPNVAQERPAAGAAPAAEFRPEKQSDQAAGGLLEVRASLPGTFYRAPRPGAEPFVEVGAYVEAETVVGIIETMKLMNAIHAGARGQVVKICVENARFVEQSTVLMRLRPEAP